MEWSPARRIAFRFGLLFAALLVFPFPLHAVPKADPLVALLTRPLELLARWSADAVLGLGELPAEARGSGDTTLAYVQLLVIAVLAAIGAAAWTALDRRRTAYPRLAAGATVVLRYYLGFTMIGYGFAKLTQFVTPGPFRIDQRVGDMSPMGLLWTMMGASKPYALFAGFAEVLAGALLLWRRTYVAGALVAIGAMSNVVALNLCYDVPVKLFSTQLLLMAVALFLPHAPRVIGALLGGAAPALAPRPRLSPRRERARLAVKALLLAGLAVQSYQMIDLALHRLPPPHELHGIWVVDRFVQDGVERPPLVTDGERWHKVYFTERHAGVRPMNGPPLRRPARLDPARRTVALEGEEPWRYALAGEGPGASLVLDGTHRGKPFHAELHREPDPLLVTRGFHWINEVPFNR